MRLRRGRAGQEVRGAPLGAGRVLQIEEGHEARRHPCRLGQLSLGEEAAVVRVRTLVLAARLGDEGRALYQLELAEVAAPLPLGRCLRLTE